jgi:type II secretory pathway component PulM
MIRLPFWQERSAGERRVIAVLAAIVAVILVITFVWLPLERARTRLSAELPRLRASIAALQRDAEEVKRLRSMPGVAVANPAPLASLPASAKLPGAQLALVDDKRVRLTAADVGFSALLDWLASTQAANGLRVESARIEALPVAGRVRAEITLAKT